MYAAPVNGGEVAGEDEEERTSSKYDGIGGKSK